MLSYLISILYYLIPVTAILFFGISLFRYLRAAHQNKKVPGTFGEKQMKSRKICLVVSSVIVGAMAAVVIAFVGLLMMAVAFM